MRDGDLLVERVLLLARMRAVAAAVPAAAGGPRLAQTGVDASRATLVGLILAGLAVGLLLVRRRMAAGRG